MNFKDFKELYQKREVLELPSSTPENPVISVLVQTYRQKDFIKECLDSILMQKTRFDFEILIGDDGSDDGTRKICIEYAEKYPEKIRLFLHHRENQIKVLGEPTSNFNAFYNFFSARGKYIAFCEGDDKWGDPLKIEKQVSFLIDHPEFSLVYHRFITINEKGFPIESDDEFSQPKGDISQEDLLTGKYHPLIFTLCFKNFLSELPSEMILVLNVDTFLLSFLGKFGQGKFISDIIPGNYRKHSGGIWSKRNTEKKFISKINTFKNLNLYYLKQGNHDLSKYFKIKHKDSIKMLLFYYLKTGWIFKFFKSLKLFANF